MGIEFGKNDFEDDSIVLDADRDHALDYPDPILSRAEQALIKAKQNKLQPTAEDFLYGYPVQKAIYEKFSKRSAEELQNEAINTVKGIADMTPVIGEIKAAYELPNDLSYAFELVESGYEEGDLKKMGLGGAFATLSAMGIIPGVRYGAKAGKEAIKSQLQKPVTLPDYEDYQSYAIAKDMEKGFVKAMGKDVKDSELSDYGKIIEELALSAKSNNGEVLEAQIVNKLQSSIGESPNAQLIDQFKVFLEGQGIKVEPLVKTIDIKAPEGLDIKAAKSQAQTLTPEEKDALSSAFDDLEQTVAPKKDIFGLTPKVQNDLINDFEMLGEAQNQIVTNKQIKDMIEKETGFTPNVQTTNEIQAALNDKGISTINSFDEFKKLTGQDIQEVSITSLEPLDKSQTTAKKDAIQKILADTKDYVKTEDTLMDLAEKQAIGGTAKIISTDQLQYVINKNIPNYTPQQMEDVVNYLTSKNVTVAANPETLAKTTGADFTQLDGLNKLMEDLADKAGMSFKLTKKQYDDLVKNAFGTETPTTNQTDFLNKILTDKNILAVSQTKPKADVIGGTFAKMDVDMTPDQKFLVDKIREKKATLRGLMDRFRQGSFNENEIDLMNRINTIDFTGKKFDMRNRADQIEIAKLLPKPIRRAMIQELNRPVPKIFHGSAGVSQPYGRGTAYAGMTRAEVLEKEGFMPFTDFEEGVEVGIGGSKGAAGKHAELGEKMLSTSRDPLVSIKRAFGDLVPANVVSAPFPRAKVRGMTREEYTAPSTKSQYVQDDTAAGLPRTRHKEAEIAFSTPEELENIRQLSQRTVRLEDSVDRDKLKNLGKMSLEDRVKTGQRFATGVKDNINSFYTRMNTLNPSSPTVTKRVQDAYADLKNLLKDTQALGQFTEQYGARGTYDSLLQTLFKDTDRTVDKLGELLPKGEKKENVQMLASVFRRMKDKQYFTDTGKSSLRGVSDKELIERMKSDDKSLLSRIDGKVNYEDLKRMVFLLTDKFNRGGLMARR